MMKGADILILNFHYFLIDIDKSPNTGTGRENILFLGSPVPMSGFL